MELKQFFDQQWEKKPILLKHGANYYQGLFTKQRFEEAIKTQSLRYSRDLRAYRYNNGTRYDAAVTGIATEQSFTELYQAGYTCQIPQPQNYFESVAALIVGLEKFFGTTIGSNAFLTPAGTQGLAPHNDEVEIFILQLEGKKEWKLHKPLLELPRTYSPDLTPQQIGEPELHVTLEEGDLLYFPRGWVHYARTSDTHSLHLTVSSYTYKDSWHCFCLNSLASCFDKCFEKDVMFREGMPINYFSYMGSAHKENGQPLPEEKIKLQREFQSHYNMVFQKLKDYVDLHQAADEMSVIFMKNRMPPVGIAFKDPTDEFQLTATSTIRFLDPTACRLVSSIEGGKLVTKVYHSLYNTQRYHMDSAFPVENPSSLEVPNEFVPLILHLFEAYPKYVSIDSLPSSQPDKITLCQWLYDSGVLQVQ